MIDPYLGVVHGGLHAYRAPQCAARAGGATVDHMADEIQHVLFGAAQPVLHRHEIGAHVLRGARDEAQQLRQATQHFHLRRATRGFLLAVAATQALQQRERAAGGLVHIEVAEAGQFHDLARRHHADHGVAMRTARAQVLENRKEVILHEQHAYNHDVGAGNVFPDPRDGALVAGVFGGGMKTEGKARVIALELRPCPPHGAGEVGVHGDDAHTDRNGRLGGTITHAHVATLPGDTARPDCTRFAQSGRCHRFVLIMKRNLKGSRSLCQLLDTHAYVISFLQLAAPDPPASR